MRSGAAQASIQILKTPLSSNEKPVIIDAVFPKLGSLLLTKLENKHKLRPILEDVDDYKPQENALEKNVLNMLEQSITKDENERNPYENRDNRDNRDSRESREIRDSRESRESREDSREDSRESREDSRENRDSSRENSRERTSRNDFGEEEVEETYENEDTGSVDEKDEEVTSNVSDNSVDSQTDTADLHLYQNYDTEKQRDFLIPPETISEHPRGTHKSEINDIIEEYEDEDMNVNEEIVDKEALNQEERSDILWSLKKLKRYQNIKSFPHYDEFTPLNDLKRILKEIKREAILDENVNQTRQYMMMGWFGLEKICTEYLSIDLSGFTAYETQNMNEYEKVLVELGERSYLNWSEGFPPEFKLLYLMVSHAALFHVKKSTSLTNLINTFDPKKSGEMRGPSKIL